MFFPAANDSQAAWPILTPAQCSRLISYGPAEETAVGDVLFRAGEPTTDLIAIESGWVEVFCDAIRERPEDLVVTHGPGRFVGEFTLFTGQTRSVGARAVSAGRIHRINLERFRNLMDTDSELSDILLRALLARRELLRTGPAARSIEILGAVSSAGTLALRTYAGRQMLANTWIDADSAEGAALLNTYALTRDDLPCVIVLGEPLPRATPGSLAERIGLSYRGDQSVVDLAVIGGGPAGLAAAVYGASEGLSTLLLDGIGVGGQAACSSRIENYLGFPFGISGEALTDLAHVQAVKFGARLSSPCQVVGLDATGPHPRLTIGDGTEIEARAVILAMGAHYRRLAVDRWDEFEGAGIYFAATDLEARACRGNPVTVVGGANSAGQAALFLAACGNPVTLAIRSRHASATMSTYLLDRLRTHPGVTLRTGTQVTGLDGDDCLSAITLTETASGVSEVTPCHGLFCFIGADPPTGWLNGPALHDDGFIRTDVALTAEDLGGAWAALGRGPLPFETNIPRVFAVGDVRYGSMKRISAAVGEGASAVRSVHAVLAAESADTPTGELIHAQQARREQPVEVDVRPAGRIGDARAPIFRNAS
jgi:thioredoxin reductase (NADPH)